jgi:hypothetical protein
MYKALANKIFILGLVAVLNLYIFMPVLQVVGRVAAEAAASVAVAMRTEDANGNYITKVEPNQTIRVKLTVTNTSEVPIHQVKFTGAVLPTTSQFSLVENPIPECINQYVSSGWISGCLIKETLNPGETHTVSLGYQSSPNLTADKAYKIYADVSFSGHSGTSSNTIALQTVSASTAQAPQPQVKPTQNTQVPEPSGQVTVPEAASNENIKVQVADPYFGTTVSGWHVPQITFDRFMPSGNHKYNEIKWSETDNLGGPILTHVETSPDGKTTKLYGVAYPKHTRIRFRVWNQYRDAIFFWNDHWELRELDIPVDHSKVVIYKVNQGQRTYLTELWNDHPTGRWETTLNLGGNLKTGDTLIAQQELYDTHQLYTLHWWTHTFDDQAIFQFWPWFSSFSNTKRVPAAGGSSNPPGKLPPGQSQLNDAISRYGGGDRAGEDFVRCNLTFRPLSKLGKHGESVLVYNHSTKQVHKIADAMWWSYRNNGHCDFLGAPTSDEDVTGNLPGWYQNFEVGSIYWSKDHKKSQPGIVVGSTRNFYHNRGGTWSDMGFPEGTRLKTNSACNTVGRYQFFQHGQYFNSPHGQYYLPYTDRFFNPYRDNGGIEALGWPTGNIYHDPSLFNHYYLPLESSVINANTFNLWINKLGCNNPFEAERSHDDPNHPGTGTIQQAENSLFSAMKRRDNGTQYGAVHTWTCDGKDVSIVDYESLTLKSGQTLGRSIMMVVDDTPYLMSGRTLDHYFFYGSCHTFGYPNRNVFVEAHPKLYSYKTIDWQSFTKATLVLDRKNWFVYPVTGKINEIYASTLDEHRLSVTDVPFVDGVLGQPVQFAGHQNVKLPREGLELGNRHAQRFEGGYIFQDYDGIYKKVANETGEAAIRGDVAALPGEVIEQFIKGVVAGAQGQIPEGDDALGLIDFALEILTIFAVGGIVAAVIALAGLVIGIISVIQLISQYWQDIVHFLESEGITAVAYLAGIISFGVLFAVIVSKAFTKIHDLVVDPLKKFARLGKAINAVETTSGALPSSVKKSLNTLAKNSDNADFLDRLAGWIEADPKLFNKLKGSVDDLSPDQFKGMVRMARVLDAEVDAADIKRVARADLFDSLDDLQLEDVAEILRSHPIDLDEYSRLANRVGGRWNTKVINDLLTASDSTLGGGAGHWFTRHVNVSDIELINRVRAESTGSGQLFSRFTNETVARTAIAEALVSSDAILVANRLLDKSAGGSRTIEPLIFLPSAGNLGVGYISDSTGNALLVDEPLNTLKLVVQADGNGGIFVLTSYPDI